MVNLVLGICELIYDLFYYLSSHQLRIVAGYRRPHKGPRTLSVHAQSGKETKPKRKSQVTARRDELMGERSPAEAIQVTQHSKDTRTDSDGTGLAGFFWVSGWEYLPGSGRVD